MSGRNTQVSRIYRILSLLEAHHMGLSALEIWKSLQDQGFDVGERTVYRDLDALEAAGFPLVEKGKSQEGGTRYVLDSGTRVGQYLALTPREVLALYLARKAISPLKNSPFSDDLQSLFGKLEDRLGSRNSEYYRELSEDLQFDSKSSWVTGISSEIVEAVRSACTERQVLQTLYSSVNSQTRRLRRLGPHYLYFSQGALYLVAEDLDEADTASAGQVKVFALQRMESAEMLDEEYTGTPLEPEALFQDSFGIFHSKNCESQKVIIRFFHPLATYVKERIWHRSQQVLAEEQSHVDLQFELGVSPEFVQWVLSFGVHAKVIEPSGLATEVRKTAHVLCEMYAQETEELRSGRTG